MPATQLSDSVMHCQIICQTIRQTDRCNAGAHQHAESFGSQLFGLPARCVIMIQTPPRCHQDGPKWRWQVQIALRCYCNIQSLTTWVSLLHDHCHLLYSDNQAALPKFSPFPLICLFDYILVILGLRRTRRACITVFKLSNGTLACLGVPSVALGRQGEFATAARSFG